MDSNFGIFVLTDEGHSTGRVSPYDVEEDYYGRDVCSMIHVNTEETLEKAKRWIEVERESDFSKHRLKYVILEIY